jgi:hypothetical protein
MLTQKSIRVLLASAALAVLAAALFAFARPAAATEETVFLQSGEQYQVDVKATQDGKLRTTLKGEERDFPLSDVQRIEFQKEREFDGLDTPEALAAASPIFKDALAMKTEDLKATYPQAGHVILRKDITLTLSKDGAFTEERTTVWRILDQRSAETSFQEMYFFPDRQKVSVVYGISVAANGEVARVDDGTMKVEAVYPSYAEYNYRQRLKFAMKSPMPGSTLFLKTRIEGRATDLIPEIVDETFWGDAPALTETVKIEGDEAALKNAAIATSGGLKADESGRQWTLENAPQIFPEPMMPPLEDFAPRVVISYPAVSWQKLAQDFLAHIDGKPLQSPAGTTAEDVFAKVRKDIRPVDVPISALPVPPASPEKTLKRGYGTEVEKALLLESLVKGVGGDASAVLVKSRASGQLAAGAPDVTSFDHALVRYKDADGKVSWLEPNSTKRGFGEISDDVQGGKGLDLRTGDLVDVPVLSPGADSTTRTVDVTLFDDGTGIVKDTRTAKGSDALALRNLADLSDEELSKWAEEQVGSSLPGVSLIEFKHSDFEKVNPVETLTFTYRIPDLAEKTGGFLVCKLPNARYAPSSVGRSAHQYDLFWLGRDCATVTFTIHAPAGYKTYAVGRSYEKKGDGWSLASGYSIPSDTTGTVVFRDEWLREALDAPKDAYPSFREALITRGILREEMIVFEKMGDGTTAGVYTGRAPGGAKVSADGLSGGKGVSKAPRTAAALGGKGSHSRAK